MYAKPPKKLLIMNILDILRKYTDENHRLSQNDILEILEREYQMKTERKAVKRNLMDLIEFGYDIEYSDSLRMIKGRSGELEESHILTDFYLNHEFTDSELRLLVDSVMFSTHISREQSQRLVKKLKGLSNIYFDSRVRYIIKPPVEKTDNRQLFYNIELLDEAISKGRKVRFHYTEYHSDKKPHKRRRADGTVREYVINPYHMAAREGKYYLICNYDKYDDVTNYRIDRICDIEILDEATKPFESLPESNGRRLDIRDYMTKHPYMFASEDIRAVFRIDKIILSDTIDMFGKNIRLTDETDEQITVTVTVNEMAVEQFAKSFTPFVEIIAPKRLREQMIDNMRIGLEKYLE